MVNQVTKRGFVLAKILLAVLAASSGGADAVVRLDAANPAVFAQQLIAEALEPEQGSLVAADRFNPQRLLPEPGPTSVGVDPDGDGVPSTVDNCPQVPNPAIDDEQPQVCGPHLSSRMDEIVFMRSRTFRPVNGVDPALAGTPALPRVHALLHATVSNGVQRNRLESMGVSFLDYVPRNTFMVSIPRDEGAWAAIVAVNWVRGLSAMDPADRVSPNLRLHGLGSGPTQVASLDVEFFEDTTPTKIDALNAPQSGV